MQLFISSYRQLMDLVEGNTIMSPEDSPLEPVDIDQLTEGGKEACSEALKSIEEKLSRLNKVEIISRLSILTQTQIGRQCIAEYCINDVPCLHFIIGLALRNETCVDKEPSEKDIDRILEDLTTYFPNFNLSLLSLASDKRKDNGVIFHAHIHELIGQLNPEKYPFQLRELMTETFGQLDDYFTETYGFTIKDAIEYSQKIIQQYENSLTARRESIQNQEITDEEKYNQFYFKTRESLEIVPEDFCKTNYIHDIEKFTNYLRTFSCSFGEGKPTYNSPLDDNLIFKRPILRHNGHYYAPIPQDLFQRLPSILEELLGLEKQKNSKIWKKYQERKSKFTEKKVTECIRRIFKEGDVYENLYYTGGDVRAEVDHIIPYCDNILIIESKSGNLSISAKRDGLKRITTNLKRLISDAHNQGLRVREFIKNEKTAQFEYSNGKKALEITYKKDRTNFILINVTLEPLLSFSSSLKNIESLGLFSQSEYPWSVNLFELDIITRHIASPALFIHYIERRLKAQDENLFSTFDELSFLGFYLEWGNFNIYLDDGSVPTKIYLDTDFLESFDQHYLYGGEAPQLKIEKEIKTIIEELEQLRPAGFTRLTNTLLDLSHKSREDLIKFIRYISFLTTTDGRRHDFSILTENNGVGLTGFSQVGREDLLENLSAYCMLKKYQCQADCWIGLGIDVLDPRRLIHEYFISEGKWKRDKRMELTVKFALEKGFLRSKPDYKL